MEARCELELAKTKAEAAETRARFHIEQAKLEAEEELLALSECGSLFASGSY